MKKIMLLMLMAFLICWSALADSGAETKGLNRLMEAAGECDSYTVSEDGASAMVAVTGNETIAEAVARLYPESELIRDMPDSVIFISDDAAGLGAFEDSAMTIYVCFGIFRLDGELTAQGAAAIMELFRPGIVITEIEYDIDDGRMLFEGEALLEGVEYEFEVSALSGQLLEWERD